MTYRTCPPLGIEDGHRFLAKVRLSTSGCWVWMGARSHKGYGSFALRPREVGGKRTFTAHRLAYATFVADLSVDLTLDHLCRNTSCVNPAHLEPVTNRVNILRGKGLAAENYRKAICIRGHVFDDANTYVSPRGGRQCRACNALHRRASTVAAA